MSNIHWQGLLKWSVSHSDGTAPTDMKPMSEEDVKFLEGAMDAVSNGELNPYKRVEQYKQVLNNPSSIDEMLETFSAIDDLIDIEPELARNIDKCGLSNYLIRYCTHEDREVQISCLSLLSLILPNNPEVQRKFHFLGLLQIVEANIMSVISDLESSDNFVSKNLGVISGLVKNEGSIEASLDKDSNIKSLICDKALTWGPRSAAKITNLKEYFGIS